MPPPLDKQDIKLPAAHSAQVELPGQVREPPPQAEQLEIDVWPLAVLIEPAEQRVQADAA